jgi:hypothetical protein
MPLESRAYSLLRAEADSLFETGQACDLMDAMSQAVQNHKDWYETYCREHLAQVPPAVQKRAEPMDYSQRKSLKKQQPAPRPAHERPFPLTVPQPTSPLETWEVMVANMLAANPGMSADAAGRAVKNQDGGAAAWERYRQQQLFGRG